MFQQLQCRVKEVPRSPHLESRYRCENHELSSPRIVTCKYIAYTLLYTEDVFCTLFRMLEHIPHTNPYTEIMFHRQRHAHKCSLFSNPYTGTNSVCNSVSIYSVYSYVYGHGICIHFTSALLLGVGRIVFCLFPFTALSCSCQY